MDELDNLAGDPKHLEAMQRLSGELNRWMGLQGDPGASIDTRDAWENVREGNHFDR
jgi:hypothetical protein